MWMLEDFLWLMVLGQIVLIVMFTWVVVQGVRSGLRSVNHLSKRSASVPSTTCSRWKWPACRSRSSRWSRTNDLLLRLDASLAARRRFIGHAAHQLRTPLSGLRLESELMLARPLPDDVRARAERIKAVSDRMIRLGQQLLVLARADPNARPQRQLRARRPVRMGAVERGRVVSRAREARHELDLVAPDTPIWIDADPLLLAELLGNLIDNALRYGNETGRIVLIVGANPPSLTVEDDRPGARRARPRVRGLLSLAHGHGRQLGPGAWPSRARMRGAWWRLTSRPIFGTRLSVVFPAKGEPHSARTHHEPGHGPRS